MKINASHPYVIAWQYIVILSAVLAFYLYPLSLIDHRLKVFIAIMVVLAIALVHVTFNFKEDVFKPKDKIFDFEILIPGWLRLIWEIIIYSGAIWVWSKSQNALFMKFYVLSILALYAMSWDRTWIMLSSIKLKQNSEY